MNDMIYVVTAVDVGDSCDGRARVLGAFKNEANAKNYVKADIEEYVEYLGDCGHADFDQMSVVNDDEDAVCLWNIEAVEVK